jgi:lipopolysaccharide/colanic/teichoic acid biosynthesis glycosyltransferase
VTSAATDKDYTLRLSPGFYELLTTGVAVTNKTFVPLLTLNENRIVGVDAALKAVLDFGLGGLLALIMLPVSAAIALILKLRNPYAPLCTRSEVIGRGGRLFSMWRFNTAPMARNGTIRRNRRFEYWLRITGLDKLPQLWNVLHGQMSLVGPRPRNNHNHVTDMHLMHNLQAVKPGMVGPWVRRDHLTSPDATHDELNYVRNWQIWLDLPILFQSAMMLASRLTHAKKITPAQGHDAWTPQIDRSLSEDLLV